MRLIVGDSARRSRLGRVVGGVVQPTLWARTVRPCRAGLRMIASRSVGVLRDMARPARVLAWHCNWCGVWVTPKKFCLLTGTCDTCVRELSDGAGW